MAKNRDLYADWKNSEYPRQWLDLPHCFLILYQVIAARIQHFGKHFRKSPLVASFTPHSQER